LSIWGSPEFFIPLPPLLPFPINPFYSSSSFLPILILKEKAPKDEEDEGEEDEEDPIRISQHFSSPFSFPHPTPMRIGWEG